MPKLIRFDWAMKSILRNKANFDVLEAFLSNLLKEEISIQDLLESESNPETEQSKFNRMDLKCMDSKGRHITIEIQTQREIDYRFRILWGASKALVESVNVGERYAGVVNVISISILYHTPPVHSNRDFIYYGTAQLIGLHTKEPLKLYVLEEQPIDGKKMAGQIEAESETSTFTDKSSNHFSDKVKKVFQENKNVVITTDSISPEYYLIFVEKFEDVINEDLDEWVYFFKHQEIKPTFRSKGIHLLSKKLDRLLISKEDGRAYDKYLDHTSRDDNMLDAGRAEGLAEGEAQGKLAVARKLIEKGLDLDSVAEVSGFSKEVLKNLK